MPIRGRIDEQHVVYLLVDDLPADHDRSAESRKKETANGTRVQVEPSEFLHIVAQEKGLVIQSRKVVLQGITYVSRCGDYYYYTISRVPLVLPKDCVVQQAKSVLL